MEGLRILMVTEFFYPDFVGGVPRVVLEISRALRRRGHEIRILTRRGPEGGQGDRVIEGFPVRAVSVSHRSTHAHALTTIAGFRVALREILRSEKVDLIHFHNSLSTAAGVWALRGQRVPTIVQIYGPWHEEFRTLVSRRRYRSPLVQHLLFPLWRGLCCAAMRGLQRYYFARATLLAPISRYVEESVRELIPPGRRGRVQVIPLGVDAEHFRPAPSREQVRAALGLPAGRHLLLTVRRLDVRMGLENLIAALPPLLREGIDLHLVIVGDGDLRDALARQAAESGLGDRVSLVGTVDEKDLPQYYQSADLFILPTLALEGFGLIALEALSSGVPVLGTPIGAIPEILAPLEPQWLFRGTRPEDIAEGIRAFFASRGDPASLARRCREYVRERFSWERTADALEGLYARALGG